MIKAAVEKVRGGNEEAKKQLPMVAMHGIFDGYRKKDLFIEASGIIILDIDDIEDDLEEVKQDIMESSNHVLSVMVGPSGDGVKILYYVNPDLVNADNYRQIGKQIVSNFDIYGKVDYLSVTDCLIMTYDTNILINKDVEPDFIYIKDTVKPKGELEERDGSKPLWEDVEDFFDTVLAENISEKTNNNYHYIQVAILDLAKFGFTHPEEDLSFVVDYAENEFKHSGENKRRFLEVSQLAKNYPQTQWPYRLIQSDDEDDEYVDYSDYTPDDAKSDTIDDTEEKEDDGLVDYDTLFDKVIETTKEGDRVGHEISLRGFADNFRFKGTGILTVTGIPSSGKTEWIDACTIDLARLFGHETIIAGFEQSTQEHVIKLIRKIIGTDTTCPSWFNKSNEPRFKKAYDFIISKFTHIDVTKTGGSIVEILRVAANRVKKSRDGGGNPRYLVLDPFNMLTVKGRFTGHEKVEEILRRITHFSHQMDILVLLVAHPFKMKKDEKTGVYLVPDFYSVKGSSAFFEMSFHGMVVYMNPDGTVMVKILKVKQNNLGNKNAEVFFNYDRSSGRYIPIDEAGNEEQGDHRDKDWLEKALNIKTK